MPDPSVWSEACVRADQERLIKDDKFFSPSAFSSSFQLIYLDDDNASLCSVDVVSNPVSSNVAHERSTEAAANPSVAPVQESEGADTSSKHGPSQTYLAVSPTLSEMASDVMGQVGSMNNIDGTSNIARPNQRSISGSSTKFIHAASPTPSEMASDIMCQIESMREENNSNASAADGEQHSTQVSEQAMQLYSKSEQLEASPTARKPLGDLSLNQSSTSSKSDHKSASPFAPSPLSSSLLAYLSPSSSVPATTATSSHMFSPTPKFHQEMAELALRSSSEVKNTTSTLLQETDLCDYLIPEEEENAELVEKVGCRQLIATESLTPLASPGDDDEQEKDVLVKSHIAVKATSPSLNPSPCKQDASPLSLPHSGGTPTPARNETNCLFCDDQEGSEAKLNVETEEGENQNESDVQDGDSNAIEASHTPVAPDDTSLPYSPCPSKHKESVCCSDDDELKGGIVIKTRVPPHSIAKSFKSDENDSIFFSEDSSLSINDRTNLFGTPRPKDKTKKPKRFRNSKEGVENLNSTPITTPYNYSQSIPVSSGCSSGEIVYNDLSPYIGGAPVFDSFKTSSQRPPSATQESDKKNVEGSNSSTSVPRLPPMSPVDFQLLSAHKKTPLPAQPQAVKETVEMVTGSVESSSKSILEDAMEKKKMLSDIKTQDEIAARITQQVYELERIRMRQVSESEKNRIRELAIQEKIYQLSLLKNAKVVENDAREAESESHVMRVKEAKEENDQSKLVIENEKNETASSIHSDAVSVGDCSEDAINNSSISSRTSRRRCQWNTIFQQATSIPFPQADDASWACKEESTDNQVNEEASQTQVNQPVTAAASSFSPYPQSVFSQDHVVSPIERKRIHRSSKRPTRIDSNVSNSQRRRDKEVNRADYMNASSSSADVFTTMHSASNQHTSSLNFTTSYVPCSITQGDTDIEEENERQAFATATIAAVEEQDDLEHPSFWDVSRFGDDEWSGGDVHNDQKEKDDSFFNSPLKISQYDIPSKSQPQSLWSPNKNDSVKESGRQSTEESTMLVQYDERMNERKEGNSQEVCVKDREYDFEKHEDSFKCIGAEEELQCELEEKQVEMKKRDVITPSSSISVEQNHVEELHKEPSTSLPPPKGNSGRQHQTMKRLLSDLNKEENDLFTSKEETEPSTKSFSCLPSMEQSMVVVTQDQDEDDNNTVSTISSEGINLICYAGDDANHSIGLINETPAVMEIIASIVLSTTSSAVGVVDEAQANQLLSNFSVSISSIEEKKSHHQASKGKGVSDIASSLTCSSLIQPGESVSVYMKFSPSMDASLGTLYASLYVQRKLITRHATLPSSSQHSSLTSSSFSIPVQGVVVGFPQIQFDSNVFIWEHKPLMLPSSICSTREEEGITKGLKNDSLLNESIGEEILLVDRSNVENSILVNELTPKVLRLRNVGEESCLVEAEILGGGGTFSIHVDASSNRQSVRQSHRFLLSRGESKSIILHCDALGGNVIGSGDGDVEVRNGASMLLVDKKHIASRSTHSSGGNHRSHDVDATLLLRVSPHFEADAMSSCCLANEACAKPYTIPMRLRYSHQLTGSVNKTCIEESIVLKDNEQSMEKKAVISSQSPDKTLVSKISGCVTRHGTQLNPYMPPVLSITPRQLLIIESSQESEDSETLSTQFNFCLREFCSTSPSDEQEKELSIRKETPNIYPNKLQDGEKVHYTLRCPHHGIEISPSKGVLTKHNPRVLVSVSVARKDAKFLQCTSIEIEYAEGNKRTVPLQIRCSSHSFDECISSQQATATNHLKKTVYSNSDVYAAKFNHCMYFKGAMVNFGTISVGSLATVKVRLCNGSFEKDEDVYVNDPYAPFSISHHYMKVKARSYVRLPVRFIPNMKGDFQASLTVKILSSSQNTSARQEDSKYCQITLVGTAV